MSDDRDDSRLVGRDEMNLSEYPITLLTERVPPGRKTIAFEDRHGTLTVTGSDDYGLPTAGDSDVIVALLYLTKLRNDFTAATVPFTKYEVLKLLGWEDKGGNYSRLEASLRRWAGVTLRYDGNWWDNDVKCRIDASFHILDDVTMFDQEVRRTLRARRQPLPLSSFTWSRRFFASCRAGNLKSLDVTTYFGLRSAVSKQLYRFLDKRFYVNNEWTFDLRELAFDHVGLSRNYTPAKLKEKLKAAIEELEEIDFLESMLYGERFSKTGRGEWRIRLIRKRPPPAAPKPEPGPEPTGLVKELIARGVTKSVAVELVRDFPENRIKSQIEHVDRPRRKIKDKAAYLVSAIREDFATKAIARPTKAEPVAVAVADQVVRQRAQTARAFWEGLTVEGRERIDAEALAQADPALRAEIEGERRPSMRRLRMSAVRDEYLKSILNVPVVG